MDAFSPFPIEGLAEALGKETTLVPFFTLLGGMTGGLGGYLQDQALRLLDSTACRYHASREELVLALTDDADAKRFQEEHGVDPRKIGGLLRAIIGG